MSNADPLLPIDFDTVTTPTTIIVILPDPDPTNPIDSVVVVVTPEDNTNDVMEEFVSI